MQTLPLFPLGTVLFPGALLPLQVFEPRYLELLQQLLEQEDGAKEFGVVSVRRGWEVGTEAPLELHDVGCVALLVQARAFTGPEGTRILVQTVGTRRFRLDALDPEAHTPYLTGLVEWIDEPDGADPAEVAVLAAALAEALAAYRQEAGLAPVELPDPPRSLSYAAADALGVALAEAQRLLATPSTAERLRLALDLVRRERGLSSGVGRLRARFSPDAPGVN